MPGAVFRNERAVPRTEIAHVNASAWYVGTGVEKREVKVRTKSARVNESRISAFLGRAFVHTSRFGTQEA